MVFLLYADVVSGEPIMEHKMEYLESSHFYSTKFQE